MSDKNPIHQRSTNDKGQITIPSEFRDKIDTDNFLVEFDKDNDKIILHYDN